MLKSFADEFLYTGFLFGSSVSISSLINGGTQYGLLYMGQKEISQMQNNLFCDDLFYINFFSH